MAKARTYEPPAEPEYFRHTGMPAWGPCVLLSRTKDTRTYLFANGGKRTFKESFCEWHFEPLGAPPSDEDRARLLRGMGAGGVATPKAIHLDLEAEIRARPDDPGPYLVYADWLIAREDPRGKLITLQHQLADTPNDKKLRDAERAILREHAAYLIPPALEPLLASRDKDPATRPELRWRLGFIEHVRLARKRQPAEGPTLAEIAASVLDHPSSQFLRSLTVGSLGTGGDNNYVDMVAAITKRARPHLQELFIGDIPDLELPFSKAGNVADVLAAAPLLRSLTLRTGQLKFTVRIEHAHLQQLRITVSDLPGPTLRRLLAAKLPELETLELACPDLAIDPAELKTMLGTVAMPELRHLALRHTVGTRAILDAIAASPLALQLETLALDHGDLDDAGVEAILATRGDRLRKLATLDLADNRLTRAGVIRLAKLSKGVQAAPRASDAPISVADVVAMAPDAKSITAARGIAKPSRWMTLGRDGDRVWGEYDGTDNYYVFARLDQRDTGCNCASPKDPCKHVLALLLIAAGGHPFAERPIPAAFVRRTYDRPRYGPFWE